MLVRIGGCAALGGLAVVLGGCAAYSGIVRRRCCAWEAGQRWGVDGVRAGCGPIESGQGSPALLMVHGFGDNPTVWSRMMAGLVSRGYRCRAMRLPGFGDTLEVRKTVGSSSWGDAVNSEVMALRGKGREVWLVAHSLGGALAIRHALAHPGSVGGLILLAPLLEVSNKRSPVLGARTWHRLLGHAVSVVETPFPEDLWKAPPAGRAEVERFITPNINGTLFAVLDEVRPRAGDIRVPVFVAVSPGDSVVNPAASEAWFERMVNVPRRKFFVARRSAHVLPLDHDADGLVAEIDAFIRRP